MSTRIAAPPQAKRLDDLSLALGEIAGQVREFPECTILADNLETLSSRAYTASLRELDHIRPAGVN